MYILSTPQIASFIPPHRLPMNIMRGLLCPLENLRLKFTNEPSIFVDGDLAESIKRRASDRLGDLVPQVRARTSPGFLHDMVLLGLCLENLFPCTVDSISYVRNFELLPTQARLR